MIARRFRIFVLIAAAMSLVGCGKQYEAENKVKDFLDENMLVKDYSVDFQKMDSTAHINDSIISRMKDAARENKLFKKDINYWTGENKGKHVYLQTKIYVGKDTVTHTFYFDTHLSGVMAFKRNG